MQPPSALPDKGMAGHILVEREFFYYKKAP